MKASETLTNNLQMVLVDLIELHIQGKQAHWSIVGTNFRDLHRQLDEIVESARGFSDEVAERMRALDAEPDGSSQTVARTTSLDRLPKGEISTHDAIDLVTNRLDATAATMRRVHDQIDEEDPTTADLLHAVIEKLEQYSWMTSAENRSPNSVKQTAPTTPNNAEKTSKAKSSPTSKKK